MRRWHGNQHCISMASHMAAQNLPALAAGSCQHSPHTHGGVILGCTCRWCLPPVHQVFRLVPCRHGRHSSCYLGCNPVPICRRALYHVWLSKAGECSLCSHIQVLLLLGRQPAVILRLCRPCRGACAVLAATNTAMNPSIFLYSCKTGACVGGSSHSVLPQQRPDMLQLQRAHPQLAARRWLVGLSYRVVYHRDPVPTQKAKAGLLASELVHVHGEIHIKDALGELAGPLTDDASGDHDWERYSQARSHSLQSVPKGASPSASVTKSRHRSPDRAPTGSCWLPAPQICLAMERPQCWLRHPSVCIESHLRMRLRAQRLPCCCAGAGFQVSDRAQA